MNILYQQWFSLVLDWLIFIYSKLKVVCLFSQVSRYGGGCVRHCKCWMALSRWRRWILVFRTGSAWEAATRPNGGDLSYRFSGSSTCKSIFLQIIIKPAYNIIYRCSRSVFLVSLSYWSFVTNHHVFNRPKPLVSV